MRIERKRERKIRWGRRKGKREDDRPIRVMHFYAMYIEPFSERIN